MRSLTPLLNVESLDRSLAFYGGVLGFEVAREFSLEGERVWARLTHGPIALMPNRSPGRLARGTRRDARSYDDLVLCLEVDDAPALHAALASAGAGPGPIRDEAYGMREFTVRDPDGYELAVQQPLG